LGLGAGEQEREQTLNQLLICLDGIEGREPVTVIAATNRPDILDAALLRAGRFDRRVRIPALSRDARLETLRIHTKGKTLAAGVSLEALADQTSGFNGAQLENLANEAALMAVRRARQANLDRVEVAADDFQRALHPPASPSQTFNELDAVLIQSTSQVTEPMGRPLVRVHLDGDSFEGEVVWADSHFVKLRNESGQVILSKAQIGRIEALEEPLPVAAVDATPDRPAEHRPNST
jgi:hypothetical protein